MRWRFQHKTKRGICERNAKISWTQVETKALLWKYPNCILKGENSIGEFQCSCNQQLQQADTGTNDSSW